MKKIYALAFTLFIALTSMSQTVSYLVVAGGGGGGCTAGGGGGGGGVLTGTISLPGSYAITVGNGGHGATSNSDTPTNGGNSSIGSIVTAIGGGYGGGQYATKGNDGGSGGGSGYANNSTSGNGTSGQGNNGGKGVTSESAGGGGGGAGGAGSNASSTIGGNGGNGISSSISGTSVTYGGGGGGSGQYVRGLGGTGGGGNGAQYQSIDATAGTANTGGGGGAGYTTISGGSGIGAADGGSGIVILSFPTGTSTSYTTTGTTTTSGENTIVTFNSSGTFAVYIPVTVNPSTAAFCIGNSVSLTASGASTYTWSPATGLNSTSGTSVIATPSTTTTYTVSGTNSSGIVSSTTVTVTVYPLPVITTSPNNPTVLGGQGAVITASGASTYTWSPSTNLNTTTGATVTANPQITKSYTITGTSAAGCVSSSAVSVAVELFQQTADTLNAPIYYGGKLGIGTTNPQAALDVTGDSKVSGLLTSSNIKVSSLSGNSGGGFVTVDSLGNLRVPTYSYSPVTTTIQHCVTQSPWMIGGNYFGNISNAIIGTCGPYDFVMESNNTPYLWLKTTGLLGIGTSSPTAQFDITASGTNAGFNINNSGGGIFSVANDGSTSIGNDGSGNNSVPSGYQLAVYGKIIAKEVVVKLLPWPDYVFTKSYKLKNLLDLENYINENHHLPNIPAAKDIESSGVQLGDMIGKQMEKIEELTLYMIELKKENEALKRKVEILETKINK